jgi:hypothetical protein
VPKTKAVPFQVFNKEVPNLVPDPRGAGGHSSKNCAKGLKRANEQKSILESDRIGGPPADFAARPVGKYDFPPAPSFRCHVAIAVGVEAT